LCTKRERDEQELDPSDPPYKSHESHKSYSMAEPRTTTHP
jgi:hypothetical protein